MIPAEWPRTIWTEARQITELLEWPPAPDDKLPPAHFWRRLRDDGRDREAALFLAQALPRYDAVAWAAEAAGRLADSFDEVDRATLAATHTWLAAPNEKNRRALVPARATDLGTGAAGLCALAAFHSGGSIAPPDQPAAAPPRGATGRFAGAAVIVAASRGGGAAELERLLDAGDRTAQTKLEKER